MIATALVLALADNLRSTDQDYHDIARRQMRIEPALRIALIYAVLSLFYVLVSDWLVEQVAADISAGLAQTTKGTVYASLSALVIYLLIRAELKKQRRLREVAMRTQRLEAIGQFATVMAHDINNMLMIMMGSLEFSQESLPPEHPAREHIANAMNAAEMAGGLTHRMLDFSRQPHLPSQPMDVNRSARELIPLLNLAAGENVSLRCNLSEGLPPVMAQPGKFENILLNLISNARDAMPNGGDVVLETAAERVVSPLSEGHWKVPAGDYVTVLVRDTGHGISKQIMERLLEPFFTTKPVGKGTGLGLTTLRDSMQAWQSHLMITSAGELGTTVKMFLTPARQMDPPDLEERTPQMTAAGKGETILLVDHAADARSAMTEQLKSLGHDVRSAASVPEAREALRDASMINLLLSNIMLDRDRIGVALAKLASADKTLKHVLKSRPASRHWAGATRRVGSFTRPN